MRTALRIISVISLILASVLLVALPVRAADTGKEAAECARELDAIVAEFRRVITASGSLFIPAVTHFAKEAEGVDGALDPWGAPYQFCPGGFTVLSAGPDGRIGWVRTRTDYGDELILADPAHPHNLDNISRPLIVATTFEDAKVFWVKEDLEMIHRAAGRYRAEHGRLPAALEDLSLRHFMTEKDGAVSLPARIRPRDPWGGEYRIEPDGSVRSLGPDGLTGGRPASLDDRVFPPKQRTKKGE